MKERSRRFSPFLAFAPAAALLVLASALCTEAVLYGRNTLFVNGLWVSSKLLMQMPLMGSAHFMGTRNALHNNHLHPSAWHGYQEVSPNVEFELGRVKMQFRLARKGHLSVLVNRDVMGASGVRLSRHPMFPSRTFTMNRRGAVITSAPLPNVPLDDSWHHLEVQLDDNRMHIAIDDVETASIPMIRKRDQFVSLRSGDFAVEVDDIELWDAAGRRVFKDRFRNTRGSSQTFMRILLVLVTGSLVLGVLACSRRGNRRMLAPSLATVSLVLAVCATIWLAFDTHVWSARYPYQGMHLPGKRSAENLSTSIERARCRLFGVEFAHPGAWWRQIRAHQMETLFRESITSWPSDTRDLGEHTLHYWLSSQQPGKVVLHTPSDPTPPAIQDNGLRVAFLGSSQAFGIGAEVALDTFVSQVHQRIAAAWPETVVETFNLSVRGSRSAALVEDYRKRWSSLKPNLLFVSLSLNDPGPEVLLQSLVELGEITRADDTSMVFLLEAAATDGGRNILAAKHDAMQKAARRLGIPVWDLHGHLASPDVVDSGFLWWDVAHLTSYGNDVAANFIWGKLEERFHDPNRDRIPTFR